MAMPIRPSLLEGMLPIFGNLSLLQPRLIPFRLMLYPIGNRPAMVHGVAGLLATLRKSLRKTRAWPNSSNRASMPEGSILSLDVFEVEQFVGGVVNWAIFVASSFCQG
jgi:hypothetical protein